MAFLGAFWGAFLGGIFWGRSFGGWFFGGHFLGSQLGKHLLQQYSILLLIAKNQPPKLTPKNLLQKMPWKNVPKKRPKKMRWKIPPKKNSKNVSTKAFFLFWLELLQMSTYYNCKVENIVFFLFSNYHYTVNFISFSVCSVSYRRFLFYPYRFPLLPYHPKKITF